MHITNLTELRKIVRKEIFSLITETQQGPYIGSKINYLINNFVPLALPDIDWQNFHLTPSQFAKEAGSFFKEVIIQIKNKTQENSAEIGNFYILPTQKLMIKNQNVKKTLDFNIEGYKNSYFPLQQGFNYNALVVFVYQDTMVDIIPINTFLHSNDNLLVKAAEKYIKFHAINFQQAKSQNKILVHNDILRMNLVMDISNHAQQNISNVNTAAAPSINKSLKNRYVKGAKMFFPAYGNGIIQKVKKTGVNDEQKNIYRLDVMFPEFNKTKTFQVATKE